MLGDKRSATHLVLSRCGFLSAFHGLGYAQDRKSTFSLSLSLSLYLYLSKQRADVAAVGRLMMTLCCSRDQRVLLTVKGREERERKWFKNIPETETTRQAL